jgi:outer membrane protein TolC
MDSMNRQFRAVMASVLIGITVSTGCHPTQPFYLRETGDLSHYLDKATKVEHPDVTTDRLPEVDQSGKPITISQPDFRELWDLSLEDCISIALNNSKIIRGGQTPRTQQGQITAGTTEGNLTDVPTGFATVYNPAIRESGVGGEDGTGVEAALSAFDTQVRVFGDQGNNGFLGRSDRPQNIFINPLIQNPAGFLRVRQLTNGGVISQMQKKTATGTTFTAAAETGYQRGTVIGGRDQFGNPLQPLNHVWTQTLEARVDQPLLRGRGEQINRIPVVIARINSDAEIAGLETRLQKMVCNVEIRYWDLYNAYRTLETAKAGRDSTQATWQVVFERTSGGVDNAQAEAQARSQYWGFEGQLKQSLRDLHDRENDLRFLLGLAPTDGRLIRPSDEPTLARVTFDWNEILAEALVKRPELRQKRWDISRRELELILSRNNLLPVLNVGGLYRWVGLGENLITANRQGTDFPAKGSTAFDTLYQGDFQEFAFTGEFQFAVGYRRELAGVTNAQLKLARERAILEEMELDVTHGLTRVMRTLDADYNLAQTYFNQWVASEKEVSAAALVYEEGLGSGAQSLNLLLEAQRRRAQAQATYYQWISEYNKALADIHCRKGSVLEYNGIAFEEGPWARKAYWDALGRARELDAARPLNYGWTRPNVVSMGSTQEAYPNASMTTGPTSGQPSALESMDTMGSPAPANGMPNRESLPPGNFEMMDELDSPQPQEADPLPGNFGTPSDSAYRSYRSRNSGISPSDRETGSMAHQSYYRPAALNQEARRSAAPGRSSSQD